MSAVRRPRLLTKTSETLQNSLPQIRIIHALFLQDQIDVHHKFKINAGVRFDDYNRERHRIFIADPATMVGVQSRNQTATTYRIGAVFAPAVEHQLYLSSSSSFTPVNQHRASLGR